MFVNGMLLILMTICLATDLKSRKIYNKVVFSGLAGAFAVHFALGGLSGLGSAAAGFAVGFAILLIPYLLGGMGAGDVKLLALVGALKGTAFVLAASVYMALIGGMIALAVLVLRPESRELARQGCLYVYSLRYGIRYPVVFDRRALSAAYPYGAAIAAGTYLCLLLKG